MSKLIKFDGRIIKKIILISLLVLAILLVTLAALFQWNKDKIAENLLLRVNDIQDGELVFDDISFNPLIHFPDMSIVLNDMQYFGQKRSVDPMDTIPIIGLQRLYIDFNVIDLIQGEFNVSDIHLENGSVNLISTDDGKLNIVNALGKSKKSSSSPKTKVKSDSTSNKTIPTPRPKPTSPKEKKAKEEDDLILNLDQINLRQIELGYRDQKNKISSNYILQSIEASLQYLSDTIICTLDANVFIKKINIGKRLSFDSVQIGLNTKLAFNNELNEIMVFPSQLNISNAKFLGSGTISLKDEGAIDMTLKGDDEDFGILNLFLTNEGVENIERGELFFDATIKGSLFDGLPTIKASFGINELDIDIPTSAHKVEELFLRGSFDSGNEPEMAGASVLIEDLRAKLPKGKIQGSLKVENFLQPKINVDLFIKSDISGFEKLIDLEGVNKLSGMMEVSTNLEGVYHIEDKIWSHHAGSSYILFEDVLVSNSKAETIEHINGKLTFSSDMLSFDTLKLNIGESSFYIDGSVSNPNLMLAKAFKNTNRIDPSLGRYSSIDTTEFSQVELALGLEGDAQDFLPFIPKQNLDTLAGGVEVKSSYTGSISWNGSVLEEINGESSISFKDVLFDIPKLNTFKNINGSVLLVNEMLYFNNLRIEYGTSDALLMGSIKNLPYLFMGTEKSIEGKLKIESEVFDYPDFFSWSSSIATAFPYRIKNIHLEVDPSTTTKGILNFVQTPRLEFKINQLDAEIENFLKPISITEGYFVLADKDSSVYLDFDDFKIELLDGRVEANVEIKTSRYAQNWLNVQSDISNVNLKDIFTYWVDSIPDYFDGVLNGKAQVNMTFGSSKIKFDQINVSSSLLNFKNEVDTIQLAGLAIAARDVNYQTSEGFLPSLSFETELSATELKIKKIESEPLRYNILAEKGTFTIVPTDRNFLKDEGEGLYIFKPFNDPPHFEFKYQVERFDIADLLENFRDEPMINGEMKLDAHLKLEGNSNKELLKSLNGYVSLYGKDLTLPGVDIDKLIEKFKRSQRFTFVDVGAVMLMGPAGLFVSKGSDYTGMATVNRDYVSKVYEFSSNYTAKNGVISFDDVALSTEHNRMAANGTIDIQNDSLNISVALLNADGCSIFSQNISGSLVDPEMGKVNAGKIILAPITNLAKKTVGVDCDIFYDGKVKQPAKNNK